MKTKIGLGVITFILLSTISTAAWAFQEPAAGTFGYEIYEFMDSMIVGAIGVCIALAILAYCIYFILRTNIFGAITCAIAALGVIKIKDIAFSLGINFPNPALTMNHFKHIYMVLMPLTLIVFTSALLTTHNLKKKNINA
jgi:hypothetical protein